MLHILIALRMDWRIFLVALGILAGCDDRATGSFETQGENQIEWSQRNPYVTEQTWADVKSLKCEATTAKRCGPNDCKSFTPSTFVRWRPAEKKYERCGGNQPCDVYDAQKKSLIPALGPTSPFQIPGSWLVDGERAIC